MARFHDVRRIATFASLAGALTALCACAGRDYGDRYSEPGKFRFLDCATIAQRSQAVSKQEKDLTSLMERANQETGGSVVNALVYSDDLNSARSDLVQLRREAAEKKCGETPAAPAPAPGRPATPRR